MKWDEMSAQERDALVAEKVMGIRAKLSAFNVQPYSLDGGGDIHYYSTDISAAWELVDKLREQEIYMQIYANAGSYECVTFVEKGGMLATREENAPNAICKAALKAVGVDIE